MQLFLAVVIGLLTVVLPISILLRLYFKKYTSNLHFAYHLPGSILAGSFIFFYGAWAFTSYYLRWVFLVLYIIVFVLSIIKHIRSSKKGKAKPKNTSYYISRMVFNLVMVVLIWAYLDGRHHKEEAVDLKFPFRSGEYYVMQGGANRFVNPAHRNFSLQKYGFAMDISKLYPSGNRARGMMPGQVTDYAIYADTILSPCSGKIILVCDTVHTNLPGHVNRSWVHGNHVFIQAKGYRVFLAHFIKNKIFVKEGDMVAAGQPLGLSGNSGFSIEPHLHINVFKNYDVANIDGDHSQDHKKVKYDDYRYSGTSAPFTFDREFYIINDIMRR